MKEIFVKKVYADLINPFPRGFTPFKISVDQLAVIGGLAVIVSVVTAVLILKNMKDD